ncbi:MAG: 50S ribosomal protein L7Ae [Nitrososphaerales archaeon]
MIEFKIFSVYLISKSVKIKGAQAADDRKMDAEKIKNKDPKPYFVKFEVPKDLSDAVYDILRQVRQSGKVKKGTNEVTKAVERGLAKLVIIAEDVEPPEIVAHLPILCEERKVPYIFVPSKAQIGSALGIDVPAASTCIVEAGEASGNLDQIIKAISKLKKS